MPDLPNRTVSPSCDGSSAWAKLASVILYAKAGTAHFEQRKIEMSEERGAVNIGGKPPTKSLYEQLEEAIIEGLKAMSRGDYAAIDRLCKEVADKDKA